MKKSSELVAAFSVMLFLVRPPASAQVINTAAGNGTFDFCGDQGPATLACLNNPVGVALDANGNVFISDFGNARIRQIDAVTGTITTVAGNGTHAFCGDEGPATTACLNGPSWLTVDGAGNLFISDGLNARVRRVDADTSLISTVAGNGAGGFCGDGGPATEACLSPSGVAVDADGNLFIGEYTCRVRRVDATTGIVETVAGNGSCDFCGDGGPATSACLHNAEGIGLDAMGNLFVTDRWNNRVRRVDALTQTIETVAGNGQFGYCGDGVPATDTCLSFPEHLALDASGNLYIVDWDNSRIRYVDMATGIISTVAGNGTFTFCGDGGPATEGCLWNPISMALDADGSFYISDFWNSRVRFVSAPRRTP